MLIKYKTGNINPIKDIGQKLFGLLNGDKYENTSNNKLNELSENRNLFIMDNFFIYFLLALKRRAFSSLLKLSYPEVAIFSKILSTSFWTLDLSELYS